MFVHDRAWDGLGIVIYGKTPLLPMKMEQAISEASPGIEIQVNSFEDYTAAFEFCKTQKNVGFLILTENCGESPVLGVFRQLGKHYEERGWPALGAIAYEGGQSISGLRAVIADRNLVSYLSASDLTSPESATVALSDLWSKFTERFEEAVLPEPLMNTLNAVALGKTTKERLAFYERSLEILTSNLNVSWIEMIALRAAPVVAIIKESNPLLLEPNPILTNLLEMVSLSTANGEILEVIGSKEALCRRVYATLNNLVASSSEGELEKLLTQLSDATKASSPAILRHLKSNSRRLLRIWAECGVQPLRRVA